MSWEFWHRLAPIIHDLGVGLGALIGALYGGYSARPWFKHWARKEKKKEQYRKKYMERFASHRRDKNDALIWKLENSDKIYAIYKPNNTKQHIKNWSTFSGLGYGGEDWDKVVNKKELDDFKEDEPIDFTR